MICLPANWRETLSGERLDWVLRHELAHIKRRDALVLFVAGIVRALHWFHPMSWIAVAKLQHSMERAADEVATRDLSERGIRDYGNLLLEYAAGQATSRQSATLGLLAMALPRGLQGRIESLANSRPRRGWLMWIVIIPMVAIISVTGLTDAKTVVPVIENPPSIPNFEVAIAGSEWKRHLADQVPSIDTRAVSINVENALRKAEELQPGVDAEKFVMAYFASSSIAADSREETSIVNGMLNLTVTAEEEATIKQRLAAFETSGPWKVATELKIIETNVRKLNWMDWSAGDSTTRCRRLDRKARFEDSQDWDELSVDSWVRPLLGTTTVELERTAAIPVRAIKITRLQRERLTDQMQRDNRSNIMQAPKMTMFNGQCGMISDVALLPFVTDVTVIRGERSSAFQPKISVFENGWKFLVKPTVNDQESVSLKMVLNHSSVDGVKQANLPNLAANQVHEDVTIQVPSVQSDSIVVESVLNEDETLLVFSPKPYSSEDDDKVRASDRGMAQVFMIQSELTSDIDILKRFVADDTGR